MTRFRVRIRSLMALVAIAALPLGTLQLGDRAGAAVFAWLFITGFLSMAIVGAHEKAVIRDVRARFWSWW